MKSFANSYISGWNVQYEDSVRLFSSETAGNWNRELFFLALLFLITAIFWYLIRHRIFLGMQLLLTFLYLPQLVLRNYSSLGAVLVLSALIGFWLFTYQAGSLLRRFIWMGSIMCILFTLMIVSGNVPPGRFSRCAVSWQNRSAQCFTARTRCRTAIF